jgi:predicted YcjX-like family ATPase
MPDVEDADAARYINEAVTGLSRAGHTPFVEIHAVKR